MSAPPPAGGRAGSRENPLLNIALNVAVPSVVMVKFSGEEWLGPFWGLVVALAFPVGYGAAGLLARGRPGVLSVLGLANVLLTGGIGLLRLPGEWMVVKETGVPLVFGLAFLASERTRRPLARVFLGEVLDLGAIDAAFAKNGHPGLFEKKLRSFSRFLGLSFFVSAALNYALVVAVLEGEPGSAQWNESLGRMTALSFPMITVPVTALTGLVFYDLYRSVRRFAGGAGLEEFLRGAG